MVLVKNYTTMSTFDKVMPGRV